MNLMTKKVGDYQFLDQAGLEQVLEAVLGRNLLRFPDVGDDLPDVVH